MSLKKKVKINGEEVDVVLIEPVKNKAELEKIQGNLKGISEFAEKLGGRYEIRMKLDKSFSNYLTQVNISLPFPAEKKFYLNLMKLLGFSYLFYYFYILILINFFLICLKDSLIDYNLKRNTEIVKWNGNVKNGILGMNRDISLQLIVFFHSYDDVRKVLFGY
jgi:hypothetical protein